MSEHFSKLLDHQARVFRVIDVVTSEYLKHTHSCSVEVKIAHIITMNLLCCVLNNLNSFNGQLSFFAMSVEVLEYSIFHDWVSLLSHLIPSWHIRIKLMLSIELNLLIQITIKCKWRQNSLVYTLHVQHWQHSWNCKICFVCSFIWFAYSIWGRGCAEQLLFRVNMCINLKRNLKLVSLENLIKLFIGVWTKASLRMHAGKHHLPRVRMCKSKFVLYTKWQHLKGNNPI